MSDWRIGAVLFCAFAAVSLVGWVIVAISNPTYWFVFGGVAVVTVIVVAVNVFLQGGHR